MSNNLRSLEKRLRSFIKRSKEIKYTKSVLHPKSWTQDWRCSFYE